MNKKLMLFTDEQQIINETIEVANLSITQSFLEKFNY